MGGTLTGRRGFLKLLAAAGAGGSLLSRASELEAALTDSSAAFFDGSPDAVRRLRAQYLVADDVTYLNHASIGTVPRPVHEAHVSYLELCETHPSLYVWGRVWRDATERTRVGLAEMLGCASDSLAITHNTTEGFNTLAHGLPIGAGDEVLFSSLNHAGASVAWRGLADRRGFTVRQFDFPLQGAAELTIDDVVRIHAEAVVDATRVLVLPHVDNVIGMLHPLTEIAKAVRERGVEYILVDGAQSAGMVPVDLGTAGVDAYAMSPHKWLQSPKGLGLFWVSPAIRDELPRMWYRTGGEAVRASARKYEDYSTRAWPAVVALGDAVDFHRSVDPDERQRRSAALWRYAHGRVAADDRLIWRSPTDDRLRSLIMAVEVRGAQSTRVASTLLSRAGAVVRAFPPPVNTLRVAPNLQTSEEELDRFFSGARS